MSDREQCNAFGMTVEDVDTDVWAFENGDWGGSGLVTPQKESQMQI